jgi:hypothetical protein
MLAAALLVLLGFAMLVVPTVTLSGSIAGLILHGLIGLFVGAVVFSIGYRLLAMTMEEADAAQGSSEGQRA